jgi:hypothetical protein
MEEAKAEIADILDGIDYALQQAATMREAAISGMVDYIGTYVAAAQAAASATEQIGVSKQPELMTAVASYRSALTAYEQLKARARSTFNDLITGRNSAHVADVDAVRDISQRALLDRARSFAQEVSAVVGNINAGGSVEHLVR